MNQCLLLWYVQWRHMLYKKRQQIHVILLFVFQLILTWPTLVQILMANSKWNLSTNFIDWLSLSTILCATPHSITRLCGPLLILGIFLLTTLSVNISGLESKEIPKAISVGRLSRSKFTVFGDKLSEDISLKTSRLLEINYAKSNRQIFKKLQHLQ